MFWPFKRNTPERKAANVNGHPGYPSGICGVPPEENVDGVRITATSESLLQPTDCTSNENSDSASDERFDAPLVSGSSIRPESGHINAPPFSNTSSLSSTNSNEEYISPSLSHVPNSNKISQDDEGETSREHTSLPELKMSNDTTERRNLPPLAKVSPHPPGVERDRSMRVIWPPKAADDPESKGSKDPQIIRLIKLLDYVLSLRSTQLKLDEFLYKPLPNFPKFKKKKSSSSLPSDEDRRSVRFIQADRYEIFVQSRNKSTEAFDWLCQQVWNKLQQGMSTEEEGGGNAQYPDPISIKNAILAFAIQQAEKDDRIAKFRFSQTQGSSADGRNVKTLYDNFSLITIYEPVTEQQKHIDLLFPNYQYGLVVTDQSPGTNVYRSAQSIKTVQHIRDYVWTDMSDTLCASMDENPSVKSLVELFGDVLCPNIQRVLYNTRNTRGDSTGSSQGGDKEETFPAGTLLCLPGSEIHAGPACDRYRTVLFFSACPDVTQTIPYHPDTQYFAPLVCCDIISAVWCKICCEDRYYLLCRLVDSIRLSKMTTLERHLFDPNMQRCVRTIVNWDDPTSSTYKFHTRKRLEGFTLYDYLWNFATIGKLASNTGTLSQNGLVDVVEPNDRLSSDGLVVEYQKHFYRAQIYRRPKQSDEVKNAPLSTTLKVQVFYPSDQSWEGQIHPYTLEWNPPLEDTNTEQAFMRFNGSNGILRDQDGVVITCYPNWRTARMAKELKPKARKGFSSPLIDRPQRERQRPPEVYTPSPLPYKAPRKRGYESSSSEEEEDE
jgi:hypothetical protein